MKGISGNRLNRIKKRKIIFLWSSNVVVTITYECYGCTL